jgi:hypothetical protein
LDEGTGNLAWGSARVAGLSGEVMIKKVLGFATACLFVFGFFFILGAVCAVLYEIFMTGFRLI